MTAASETLRGGIDLGGTKIQTVIVDAGGAVRGEARQPTPTSGGPTDVARAMEDALREAASAAGTKPEDLAGVGVGSPGDADGSTGIVSGARNLPGWEGSFPLGEVLSEALGTEVRIGNDVQVAVEGEYALGAGKQHKSLLGVWWGTGVGGGIILDGEPWLGRGAAGEIGHMVVKRDGARCPCGRRGCMEAYAGRAAMEAKARHEHAQGVETEIFKIMEKRGKDRLTSSVWEHALREGDALTESLLRRAVRYLGTGIASAVNLLDVEAVVIGGGLGVRFGDHFMDDLHKEMHKHLFVDDNPPLMQVAELGDLGGAIGASLLVGR
ncbi:MAG TPA: ROK family protein [Solirubrobacterales bacterium]|nr:ROK family protein [Solirubrobacterales bacterium]